MKLGVYWYFDFPNGLYGYEFFKFVKGIGGHAGNPAELIAIVESNNPEYLIRDLKHLTESHEDASIFIRQNGNHLKIGIGGYQLYDFEFELCNEIEKIIKNSAVRKSNQADFRNTEIMRLHHEQTPRVIKPKKKLFQFVGSPLRKYNAETYSIRLDCNIRTIQKENFLSELVNSSNEFNINVIYYLEKKCKENTNLMLFFTNGRQGVGLKPTQKVNIQKIEEKIEQLMNSYGVNVGHLNGMKSYPVGKPKILKIIDKEFVIE